MTTPNGLQFGIFPTPNAASFVPSSSYIPPEKLGPMNARIDDGATEAERNPDEIRRIYNTSVEPSDRAQRKASWQATNRVTELTELVEGYRMDSFILWLNDDAEGQI